jgi:hypothetical protein
MLPFNSSVNEIVRQRYSCRAYQKIPIAVEQASQLEAVAASLHTGPLNTSLRFELALTMPQEPQALRGLGTYGLIKDPAGFIIGAVGKAQNNLEDFGYEMEFLILYATSIGLDTCWLGGNFTKSSFSSRIKTTQDESVPAVASIGYAADQIRTRDRLRQQVKSDTRLPWGELFFQSDFRTPLTEADAGEYSIPLEMVRLSPSGHNYQPWRVLRGESCFHFYLQRTLGYGPGSPMFTLMGIADLQRMEIGIAMCHFELATREIGLAGKWIVNDPLIRKPDERFEYIVTWLAR